MFRNERDNFRYSPSSNPMRAQCKSETHLYIEKLIQSEHVDANPYKEGYKFLQYWRFNWVKYEKKNLLI